MDHPVNITVPPASPEFIIFHFHSFTKRFDSSSYYPHLTDGRASVEDINHVLRELEMTQKPYNSKLLSALICYIIFVLIPVGFYVASIQNFLDLDIVIICIYFVIFVAAVVINLVIYIIRTRKLREEMKAKCKAVTDKHNQYFVTRGLRWHIPVNFPKSIELWKDYNNQGQPSWNFGAPYQPQVQQNYYQNYLGQGNNNVYNPVPQH